MSITAFEIALALVRRDDTWLVAKRRNEDHLGGLWEFPGGKREEYESIVDAALRELREECGVSATAERSLAPIAYDYETRRVEITPVLCHHLAGEARPLASVECKWVTFAELERLPMPAANAAILSVLRDEA
jgi:mutator protein MutT